MYFTNSRNGFGILSVLAARTLGQPLRGITDFLGYDSYQSPLTQVRRNLLAKGVAATTAPFLNPSVLASGPHLTENEVLELAAELGASAHPDKAAELLALGTTYYPQSTALLHAYGLACVKKGDYPQAATVLRRYAATVPGDEVAQALVKQLTHPASEGNVVLRLTGFPVARYIALAGSFNQWQPMRTLFFKDNVGWHCRLHLPAGKYSYKIIVDGNWQNDPSNPQTESDGNGNTNSILTVPAN